MSSPSRSIRASEPSRRGCVSIDQVKAFRCRVCSNPLYFENSLCVSCGTGLGYSRLEREIGDALFLSINTVKGYVKSLYRKLDVGTRQDAVQRARALKLI